MLSELTAQQLAGHRASRATGPRDGRTVGKSMLPSDKRLLPARAPWVRAGGVGSCRRIHALALAVVAVKVFGWAGRLGLGCLASWRGTAGARAPFPLLAGRPTFLSSSLSPSSIHPLLPTPKSTANASTSEPIPREERPQWAHPVASQRSVPSVPHRPRDARRPPGPSVLRLALGQNERARAVVVRSATRPPLGPSDLPRGSPHCKEGSCSRRMSEHIVVRTSD